MSSNLPSWLGADVVYTRAARIAAHLNAQEYASQRAAQKRPLKRFSPNAEAETIITAMNRGDEETLKAMVHTRLAIALGN